MDCATEAVGCARLEAVDYGYGVYTAAPGGLDDSGAEPVLVLLGMADFPAPWWVERNGTSEEELVQANWRTPHCRGAPYLQTKFFNWCAAATHGSSNRCRRQACCMRSCMLRGPLSGRALTRMCRHCA